MPKVAEFQPLSLDALDEQNLLASGLTRSTMRANKLKSQNKALYFPYRNLDGEEIPFKRWRPQTPRIDAKGKPVKYEQVRLSAPHPYFPVESLTALRETDGDILITEGEKKALLLAQSGYAAIGIGGVECWHAKGSLELIPDLAGVPFTGRNVGIVFDYDDKEETRRNVATALVKLADALLAAGASQVYRVALPAGPDGSKQGVDDFVVAHGPEAFRALVEEAEPVGNSIIKIITPVEAGEIGGGNKVIKIIPPVLGDAAYYGLPGKFLKGVADFTEATEAGILAHLLPACGTLMGSGPHVYAGSKQPARVNVALVGPTNRGRKGTAAAPVELLMMRVDAEFWKAQRASGMSSGEGLITKVADRWEKNDDDEMEMVPVEKRLYVIEPEFSRVLANIRREGNVLSQVMREAYDSGNLSTLTVTPRTASGAHISIVAHVTPEELRQRLSHVEMANGFGNRFMWFYVESDKLLPHPEPIPDRVFLPFEPALRMIHLLGTMCQDLPIKLDESAKRRWEEIYPSLREDRPGLAGAMIARGSSMVLRLSLIYCLLERWKSATTPVLINVDHLEAALAVWRYCEESAAQLFAKQGGDYLSKKVLALLDDGPKTKTDLNKHLSPRQKELIEETLSELEREGQIRQSIVKQQGRGRPSEKWELVRPA